ncbi:unnamed protein product [Prorocentrum cordatum]|uniref:Uncharacterized protein n=1 Tax=Prorocentrum cordatum TaxID=2364126 RepID=A0ABN9ST70_9DINO|nr:unnamed protein product [Polarella glacialis]
MYPPPLAQRPVPSILAAVRTQFLPLSLPTFAVMARAAPIILLGLTRQCQAISLRAEPADACLDAVPGDSCHNFVAWALDKGVEQHPEWFPSFKRSDSDVRNFMQVQDILHSRNKAGCGKPCDMEYLDVIGKLEKELSAMDTNSPAFETRLAEKREKINKLKAALELKAKGKAQQLQDQQKRQKLEAELKALESMEDSPASQTLIAEKRAQIQNLQTADKSESELKALEIQRLQDPAAAAMDAKDAAAGRKSWWQRWREAKGTAPTAAAPEAKPAPAAAVEEAKPEAAAPSPPAAEEEAKPEAATPSPAAEEAELEAELMAAAAGEAQPSHNAPLAEAPPAAGAPPAAEEEPAEEMPSADAEPQKEARAAREPESAVMEVPAQARGLGLRPQLGLPLRPAGRRLARGGPRLRTAAGGVAQSATLLGTRSVFGGGGPCRWPLPGFVKPWSGDKKVSLRWAPPPVLLSGLRDLASLAP